MSKYNTAVGADLSKPQEGGGKFVKEPLKEGSAVIRLIQYVEYGVQPRKAYDGEPKAPIKQAQVSFEVVSKRHLEEYEVEGETKTGARFVNLKMMAISNHPKSNYSKIFQTLNYAGKATQFYELIGDTFACTLVNNKVGDKTYTNITDIKPPLRDELDEDGEATGNKIPLKAHTQINDSKVFLWDQPYKEDFDALKIESNNFIQEKILSALNYEGSPLQALLCGINLDEVEETADAVVNSEDQLDGIV